MPRRCAVLTVAWLGSLAILPRPGATQQPAAPAPAETTLTIQGFVQNDEHVDLWTLVAPLPLRALGLRTFVLQLTGQKDRWRRYLNQYVEARGRVTRLPGGGQPGIGLEVDKMASRDPPGTTHLAVDRGTTQHADVSLAVVPNHFAWRGAQGEPTGVNPIALFTIVNRRDAPIFFVLPNNDFLCITVKDIQGAAVWDSTTRVASPDARRFAVQRGGIFRDAIGLPESVAARPGRYVARVGICAIDAYDITAEFVVE